MEGKQNSFISRVITNSSLWLGSAGETAFMRRWISFTAGYENWIEQHSKQDSCNYLIQQVYLQLLRYN